MNQKEHYDPNNGPSSIQNLSHVFQSRVCTKEMYYLTVLLNLSGSDQGSAGTYINPNPIGVFAAYPETQITGLAAGVEYMVSVYTQKGSVKGTAKTATFNTKPNPLTSSDVITFTISSTIAVVHWVAPPGTLDKYVISITPTTGGARANPSAVNNGTTSTGLESLTPGTLYSVEVRTRSGTLESDGVSNSFTTKPAEVSRATLDVTAITASSATLNWGAVTTGNFVDYIISISPTIGRETVNQSTVLKGAETRTSLTRLTGGTTYTVTLKTRISGMESNPATHTFTTKPDTVDSASVTVGDTATTTTAILSWIAVTTPFQTYEITISPTAGGAKASPASVASGKTATFLESLTPGTEYTVVIKTRNGILESESATMKFRTKPLQVSSVEIVELTTTTATVKWTPVTVDDKYTAIYSYQVDIMPPGPTVVPHEVRHPGSSTGVTGLTPDTKYKVKVATIVRTDTLVAMSDPAEIDFTSKPDFIIVPIIAGIAVSVIIIVIVVVVVCLLHRRRQGCFAGTHQYEEDRSRDLEIDMKQLETVDDEGYEIPKSHHSKDSAGDNVSGVMTHADVRNKDTGDYEVPKALSLVRPNDDGYAVLRPNDNAGCRDPPATGPQGTDNTESRQSVKLRPKSRHKLEGVTDEEFKLWLLSKDVTEDTYWTLVRHGFQKASVFAILDPEAVLKLEIKPLAQEMLLQRIVKSFSTDSTKRSTKRKGSESEVIYDEIIENPYLSLC